MKGRVRNLVKVATKDLGFGALEFDNGTSFAEAALFEEGGGAFFGLKIESAGGIPRPKTNGLEVSPGLFVSDEHSFHNPVRYRKNLWIALTGLL